MINRDFRVFPVFKVVDGKCACGAIDCTDQGKHPSISAWQSRSMYLDSMDFSNNNYGIPTGSTNRLVVIDVDPRNGGFESFNELEKKIGVLDATWTVKTPGGGFHLYYQYDEKIKTSHGKLGAGIDVQAENAYVLAVDSNHLNGIYRWEDGCSPHDLPLETLPEKLLALLEPKLEPIEPLKRNDKLTKSQFAEVEIALDLIECTSYEQWINIGMALHAIDGHGEKPLELWDKWSQKDDRYKSFDEIKKKWNSFKCGTITSTYIFAEVKRQGHDTKSIRVESDVKLPDFDKLVNNVFELPQPERAPTYFNQLPPGRAGELVQAFDNHFDTVPSHISLFMIGQMLPASLFQGLCKTYLKGSVSAIGLITGSQGTGKSIVIKSVKKIIQSVSPEKPFMPWAASGTALRQQLSKKDGCGLVFKDELLHHFKTIQKKHEQGDNMQELLLTLWSSNEDLVMEEQKAANAMYDCPELVSPAFSMVGGGITDDWSRMTNDYTFMTQGFGTRLEVVEWGKILVPKTMHSRYSLDLECFEDQLVFLRDLLETATAKFSLNNRLEVPATKEAQVLRYEYLKKCIEKDNDEISSRSLPRQRNAEHAIKTATRIALLNAHAVNGKIEGLEVNAEIMAWSISYVESRYNVMFDNSENSETDETRFYKKVISYLGNKKMATKRAIMNSPGKNFDRGLRNDIFNNMVESGDIVKDLRYFKLPSLKKIK